MGGLAVSVPFHSTDPAPLILAVSHTACHVHTATCRQGEGERYVEGGGGRGREVEGGGGGRGVA